MSMDTAVKLLEMPEHDTISVMVDAGDDDIFALGERINARWEPAYMNGYNWEALIHAWVAARDPELEAAVERDPEGGAYVGFITPHNPENVARMRRFEALIRELLADEAALYAFIEANDIPWD